MIIAGEVIQSSHYIARKRMDSTTFFLLRCPLSEDTKAESKECWEFGQYTCISCLGRCFRSILTKN